MDRLTWFIHSADRQCLDQAVRVATLHPVDLRRIGKWANKEMPNGRARFLEFSRMLDDARNRSR